jgi:RNA polymerase sigma factor for flagellar operon FliA
MLPKASGDTGSAGSKYEVLADEDELWKRWEEKQDERARDRIVHHYMSYAKALAAKLYTRRTHDDFEFQEYMQFASVGLMESVNRFKNERGVLFKTFATTRINGAVLSGIALLSERQQQINLRRRVAEERVASLQKEKKSEDPEKMLRELAEIGIGLALGYLLEGTGMVANPEAAIPDNTYTRMELNQLQQQVIYLTRQLTAREREVIQMHYHQNMAFEEIAMELNLTKGRISQLHKQGLERLRTLIKKIESCDIAL